MTACGKGEILLESFRQQDAERDMKLSKSVRILLDVIHDFHDVTSFEDFGKVLHESVPRLIGADSYDVVCFGNLCEEDNWYLGTQGGFTAENARDMLNYLSEKPQGHPVSRQFLKKPFAGPIRISDLVSLSEWRSTEFYNLFSRYFKLDYEIDCQLPGVGLQGHAAVSISRDRKDFRKSDVETVNHLIRPMTLALNRLSRERRESAKDLSRIFEVLTPKEMEVLLWIVEGKSDLEISGILGQSRHTTSTHVRNLLQKLGVESRLAAAMLVVRERGKNTED